MWRQAHFRFRDTPAAERMVPATLETRPHTSGVRLEEVGGANTRDKAIRYDRRPPGLATEAIMGRRMFSPPLKCTPQRRRGSIDSHRPNAAFIVCICLKTKCLLIVELNRFYEVDIRRQLGSTRHFRLFARRPSVWNCILYNQKRN